MTIDSLPTERPSATIYQFPVGGRRRVEARRVEVMPTATSELSARVAASAFDSWYHEAAIQESIKESKRAQ
jgi:hypothetical protein